MSEQNINKAREIAKQLVETRLRSVMGNKAVDNFVQAYRKLPLTVSADDNPTIADYFNMLVSNTPNPVPAELSTLPLWHFADGQKPPSQQDLQALYDHFATPPLPTEGLYRTIQNGTEAVAATLGYTLNTERKISLAPSQSTNLDRAQGILLHALNEPLSSFFKPEQIQELLSFAAKSNTPLPNNPKLSDLVSHRARYNGAEGLLMVLDFANDRNKVPTEQQIDKFLADIDGTLQFLYHGAGHEDHKVAENCFANYSAMRHINEAFHSMLYSMGMGNKVPLTLETHDEEPEPDIEVQQEAPHRLYDYMYEETLQKAQKILSRGLSQKLQNIIPDGIDAFRKDCESAGVPAYDTPTLKNFIELHEVISSGFEALHPIRAFIADPMQVPSHDEMVQAVRLMTHLIDNCEQNSEDLKVFTAIKHTLKEAAKALDMELPQAKPLRSKNAQTILTTAVSATVPEHWEELKKNFSLKEDATVADFLRSYGTLGSTTGLTATWNQLIDHLLTNSPPPTAKQLELLESELEQEKTISAQGQMIGGVDAKKFHRDMRQVIRMIVEIGKEDALAKPMEKLSVFLRGHIPAPANMEEVFPPQSDTLHTQHQQDDESQMQPRRGDVLVDLYKEYAATYRIDCSPLAAFIHACEYGRPPYAACLDKAHNMLTIIEKTLEQDAAELPKHDCYNDDREDTQAKIELCRQTKLLVEEFAHEMDVTLSNAKSLDGALLPVQHIKAPPEPVKRPGSGVSEAKLKKWLSENPKRDGPN